MLNPTVSRLRSFRTFFLFFFFPLFNIYARRFRNEDFTHRRGRYKLMFFPFFFFPFLAAIQNTQRIDLYAGLYQDSRASLSLVRLYNIIQKSNCVEREIIGWTNRRLVCASSFFFLLLLALRKADHSRDKHRFTVIEFVFFFFTLLMRRNSLQIYLQTSSFFVFSLSPSLFTFFFRRHLNWRSFGNGSLFADGAPLNLCLSFVNPKYIFFLFTHYRVYITLRTPLMRPLMGGEVIISTGFGWDICNNAENIFLSVIVW